MFSLCRPLLMKFNDHILYFYMIRQVDTQNFGTWDPYEILRHPILKKSLLGVVALWAHKVAKILLSMANTVDGTLQPGHEHSSSHTILDIQHQRFKNQFILREEALNWPHKFSTFTLLEHYDFQFDSKEYVASKPQSKAVLEPKITLIVGRDYIEVAVVWSSGHGLNCSSDISSKTKYEKILSRWLPFNRFLAKPLNLSFGVNSNL